MVELKICFNCRLFESREFNETTLSRFDASGYAIEERESECKSRDYLPLAILGFANLEFQAFCTTSVQSYQRSFTAIVAFLYNRRILFL